MKILNKKIIIETTIGGELLKGILNATIISFLIYMYFNKWHFMMHNVILYGVSQSFELTEVSFRLVKFLFPIILIICLVLKSINIIFSRKK